VFSWLPCALLLLWASPSTSAQAEPIHVAVAANFTQTLAALVERFEQQHDHQVVMSSGSSGKLYAQIQHGAPFDIFLSADTEKPAALERSGLTQPGARFTYALGALALWAPKLTAIDDGPALLETGGITRLALANPRLAPYGTAAADVLEHFKLTDITRERWVLGENIAQTYQFIASGAADAGFVALAQLRNGPAEIYGAVWHVPSSLHRPIAQQAVLLRPAADKEGALAFWEFLQSEQARSIIARHGYTVAP